MSVPAILYRISTQEIIYRKPFPGDPTQELPGLDPDYKWLIVYTPFVPPTYDIRLFKLVTTETITSDPHPDYPLYSKFEVKYATEKLPVETIAAHVENAERAALLRVFPPQDQLKTIALGLGVLAKASKNLALEPDEQQKLTDVITLSDKLWQNSDNAATLKTAAANGEEPNFDAGWAQPEAPAP